MSDEPDPRVAGGAATDGEGNDGDDERDGAPDSDDIDPITLEVLRNAFAAVAEEMNANLVRTGYSPNITERKDCSCALFDADGEMLSQAETMPVHLGAMPFSVAAALERFPPETLSPGDAVVLNDPFRGGAHLPDLTLVTPIFVDDGGTGGAVAADSAGESAGGEPVTDDLELLGFAANRAHHADIGGSRAGSVAADSTEIYQEGLRIPPVKLYDGGDVVDDVVDLLLANVRTPDERRGDLRAQHAANETGRTRLLELAADHGIDTLRTAVDAVQDYAEKRMRAAIADLPDGTYGYADVLDDDGRASEDVRIEATVTIDGDALTVDFDGTDAQTAGPINAVFAVTASATYYAVRCVTDPEIPANAGAYRPIDIETPEGSVVDAEPPAAVVGGNLETSQRVTDVVLGALAEIAPERALAAGQGTMNNVTFGGVDPRTDDPYAFYETGGGGFGAHANGDGMDGVHVHMSNTMNTPAEVLETAYPLSVERYAYRPDTGGAGEFRGGLGLRRDIRVRATGSTGAAFSLLADRRTHAPYGVAGGENGAPGEDVLYSAAARQGDADDVDEPDEHAEALPAKCTRRLDAGDVVSIRTPGGGGYGDPADRDPAALRRDLADGLLSVEDARQAYGADLVERAGADLDATADDDESARSR
ncbi:N-methylhydantoinase B/acetone carboxylase, alpha subunit [Halovivax ruber XH-70]|uniref:N-methylhydantoinase B/acetone carboxylase, alpha subunit n=1 Tax=Halovivax ruber (strain DSM 18193 / JCM 13892 / XH-70) TaxID=797302 RepID=L0I5F6_HALRX|nr:hydantoinase B/oxoprolinase family protein [Halovivax ruber]AGB14755.1 N-methylhydantoinase B/acetone carboxylase, alpha subunit [Halovivax ruber XH-70]